MTFHEILEWLRETRKWRLEELWRCADRVRQEYVGDAVHLRGLVEISNYCVRRCTYCGINATRHDLPRYRMTAEEILACARQAVAFDYGTIVLQSGEDYGITTDWIADLIRSIKSETNLAVTLSLGERPEEDLRAWRNAGADRYLLRFETSNRGLYERIHPPLPGRRSDRFALLRRLAELGYEVGSGVMVGIPGQTYADLARDIEAFAALDLDMIGIGPFIPHPATPLGQAEHTVGAPADQVPNTEEMTCKVIALARLVCPWANIPSTTALATINPGSGREAGLRRGANVVMPNLTPPPYRAMYEIYPVKVCAFESPDVFDAVLKQRILALGRHIGTGRGDARKRRESLAEKRGEL